MNSLRSVWAMWMAIAGVAILVSLLGALMTLIRTCRHIERNLATLQTGHADELHRARQRLDDTRQAVNAMDGEIVAMDVRRERKAAGGC